MTKAKISSWWRRCRTKHPLSWGKSQDPTPILSKGRLLHGDKQETPSQEQPDTRQSLGDEELEIPTLEAKMQRLRLDTFYEPSIE